MGLKHLHSLQECELEEQKRLADQQKRREEIKEKDMKYSEERRDRKMSQYYIKILEQHGEKSVEELIHLSNHDGTQDEPDSAENKKQQVQKMLYS